jgi:hypothetical protein
LCAGQPTRTTRSGAESSGDFGERLNMPSIDAQNARSGKCGMSHLGTTQTCQVSRHLATFIDRSGSPDWS